MCIQVKDIIFLNGTKYDLYTTPLDSYWTRRHPKPPIRLTKSTCWQGYVASWEISDNNLYLIDIIYYSPKGDLGLDYLFPHNTAKIKADWLTDELLIPIGDRLPTCDMWEPVYDSDWFIKIKKSKVLSQRYKANF
jgi:hypothetical protein